MGRLTRISAIFGAKLICMSKYMRMYNICSDDKYTSRQHSNGKAEKMSHKPYCEVDARFN